MELNRSFRNCVNRACEGNAGGGRKGVLDRSALRGCEESACIALCSCSWTKQHVRCVKRTNAGGRYCAVGQHIGTLLSSVACPKKPGTRIKPGAAGRDGIGTARLELPNPA